MSRWTIPIAGFASLLSLAPAASIAASAPSWFIGVDRLGEDFRLYSSPDLRGNDLNGVSVKAGAEVTSWLSVTLEATTPRYLDWRIVIGCAACPGPGIPPISGEARFTSYVLAARPRWDIGRGFGLHGMFGYMHWKADSDGTAAAPSLGATDVIRGLGASYQFASHWEVVIERRQTTLSDHDASASRYSAHMLGLNYRF